LFIPQNVVGEALRLAEGLTEQEIKLRSELQNGMSPEQALAKFGHV
jgi:hypothetical protein